MIYNILNEDILDNLTNPKIISKLVFGRKDSRKYTRLSLLEKLYIHEKISEVFMNRQKDYINYKVIIIRRLEQGDVSDILLNDFYIP